MLRPQRLVWIAGLLLFAGLAFYGARVHWVEEIGTAERDGYVAEAERILAGEAPHDPFRPPLYPYAVAALTPIAGEAFTAARLLSNLSAAALALLACAFARRLAPTERADAAGLWAFALVAANPNTWILGQHTTTDMPFAALATATLYAGLRYLERPTALGAALTGVAWATAAATRGNAALLLPGLLAAWWLAGSTAAVSATETKTASPRRPRLAHLALATGLAVLVLTPQWILRARTFGDAFHDENWKNLAWKLDGYPDWSKLEATPTGGSFAKIVLERPGAVLRGTVSELGRFAGSGLAQLFGTWLHVLALAVFAWLTVRARPRLAGWLVGTGALFTLGVAVVFFTWGRFLLLLLPIGAALVTAAPLEDWAWTRRRLWIDAVLAALVAVLAVKTAAFRLPAFAAHHPTRDVAALRELDAKLSRGQALAGTSPFLERYLKHPYVTIPDTFGAEITSPAPYLARLVETLAKRHVAYLVVDAMDLRDRPRALLGDGAPPAGLELVHGAEGADGVALWRVSATPAH
jgi:hypothetical protein